MSSHSTVKQGPAAAAVGLSRDRGSVRGDGHEHRAQGKALAKGAGHRLLRAWGAHPQWKQPRVWVFNRTVAWSGTALITMGTRSSKQSEIIPENITASPHISLRWINSRAGSDSVQQKAQPGHHRAPPKGNPSVALRDGAPENPNQGLLGVIPHRHPLPTGSLGRAGNAQGRASPPGMRAEPWGCDRTCHWAALSPPVPLIITWPLWLSHFHRNVGPSLHSG